LLQIRDERTEINEQSTKKVFGPVNTSRLSGGRLSLVLLPNELHSTFKAFEI
jgi:hypothetical protein